MGLDGNTEFGKRSERDQLHSRRYMPGLDGLRAVAVLAVLAYHLNLPWAPGGLLGVCIFFVLSGYLITDILLAQWSLSGTLNLEEFWLGRVRRLVPAMFTMLGGVIGWLFFYDPSRLSALWNEVLAALFYSSNWWLIWREVSYFASFGPPSPLGHLWSLAVEGQFYLLWPLLLGLGLRYIRPRGRLAGSILALVIASAAAMAIIYQPGLDPSRVYYGTDTRAFALLIGAALAVLWPSRGFSAQLPPRARMTLDIAGGTALLAILAMIGLSNQYQSFLYYGGLLLFSVIAAVLVAVLAHPASRLGRLFGVSPLRWLGVWSYGIFLWHYPVIVLTSPLINTGGVNVGLVLTQTVLSISLAAVSWFFIEEPIRRGKWGQHWEQLAHGLKSRPRRPPFRSKATLTNMVCIAGAFLLAVSGFTMISHAQQKSSPSELGTAIGPAAVLETDRGANNSHAAAATVNQGAGQNPGCSGEGVTVIDDLLMIRENGVNGAAAPCVDTINPGASQDQGFTGKGVTVIGDSVMVGVGPELKRRFPDVIVDAAIGRQMYEAPQVIKHLQTQGLLGKTVIIELGANGPFIEQQFMDILDLMGHDTRIVLINARVPKPWESSVNQVLAQLAATQPHVELVDWYSASGGHNEYFLTDGVHVNETGIKAYVSLLANALTH